MTKFNYSLNQNDYNIENVLCWGNCSRHAYIAFTGEFEGREVVSIKERVVHGLIAAAEMLPLISQIASLIEFAVIKIFGAEVSPSNAVLDNDVEQSDASASSTTRKTEEVAKGNLTIPNVLFKMNSYITSGDMPWIHYTVDGTTWLTKALTLKSQPDEWEVELAVPQDNTLEYKLFKAAPGDEDDNSKRSWMSGDNKKIGWNDYAMDEDVRVAQEKVVSWR